MLLGEDHIRQESIYTSARAIYVKYGNDAFYGVQLYAGFRHDRLQAIESLRLGMCDECDFTLESNRNSL